MRRSIVHGLSLAALTIASFVAGCQGPTRCETCCNTSGEEGTATFDNCSQLCAAADSARQKEAKTIGCLAEWNELDNCLVDKEVCVLSGGVCEGGLTKTECDALKAAYCLCRNTALNIIAGSPGSF